MLRSVSACKTLSFTSLRRLSAATSRYPAPQEEETFAAILRRCAATSNLRHGRALHAKFLVGSHPSTLFTINHVLNMYVKCGDLRSGRNLFDEMPHRNTVSWSALLAGLAQSGLPEDALMLFVEMRRDASSTPNEFTLVSALHGCSMVEESHSLGYQIYGYVIRLGFGSNAYLGNAFLTGLIRKGRFSEALEVFDKLENRDVVSWNAMMNGYVQFCFLAIPNFWVRMIGNGMKPDHFTFSTILTGLADIPDLKMGLQVHGQLLKYGHGSETLVGNALADMYLKNQKLEEGFRAFEETPSKDVSSWTQMASGFFQCGDPEKALKIIEEMKMKGIDPNKFTLATALNACANTASLEEGKKAHGLRIKLGDDDIDVCVDNALIDMYVKCGSMDDAWKAFQTMRDRTVVSWTTMIMGCARNGRAKEALVVFEEMIDKGTEPNKITFVSVLSACSQGGFLDEGWKYFSMMIDDYQITPEEDHYVCMVNLLGRAGCIQEAEELISSVPFRPSVLMWQTLLGACLFHGDMDRAKRVAEQALDVDRNDPSTYVMLSNVFADLKKWDSVGMLRDLMENRDVKKMPGSTWIGLHKG